MGAIAEDVRVVGTLGAANDRVTVNQPGTAVVTVQLSGTFVGTVVFEVDDIEGASPGWTAVNAQNVTSGALVASATAPGIFRIDASGLRKVSVKCSLYTSGTVSVTLNASAATAAPGLTAGTGGGAVTQSGTWTVQPGNTANTTAWKVDNSAVTQPISAVSLPLPTGAALDATIGTTNTQVGGLTEAAPATDIAGSGLNGRLQRVAQRLTSLIALLPTALVSNRLDVNLGAAPATVSAQGAQTAGAGVSTNPLLVGGSDGTNARFLVTDTTGRTQVVGAAADGAAVAGSPVLVGQINNANSNATTIRGQAANSDAVSALAVGTITTGRNLHYNGSTWDLMRGNTTVVVQASTLTTVQTINTDIINYNGRAFMAHANVSNYNGGSILMKLQLKDANGLFVDIPGATTGTVASGADVLLNVGPTVWPANSATMFNVNFFLPRNIRLVTTIATASVTFSQSYDLPAN